MNEFDKNNSNQFNDDLNNYIKKDEPVENTVPQTNQSDVNEQRKTEEQYSHAQPTNQGYYVNGYGYPPYTYSPQNNPYGAPYGTPYGQGIAYSPEKEKKQRKEKKGANGKVIALVCCATVICSALFGFAGAYAGNRFAADNAPANSSNPTVNNPSANSPMVIYKDVSDIQTSTDKNGGDVLTYSQVAALVKNSVVEITTEYNVKSAWYNYVTKGAGSGVIISENGYIVTNAHVITGDTSAVADNIIVRLGDGTEYTATTVGYDTDADIAIIKIDASGLSPAVCGNSDNLAVGEELVVVGNPLGELGGTVTNGIVSATERQISVNGVTMTLIQTNAAVSPGNSGGGMFNMQGQLVGIINAKSSGSGVEGLGFAIPINGALSVIEQLMEYGYVRGKTYIGVEFETVSSSNSLIFFYGIKPGIYVNSLVKGYNDQALKLGDRVVAINEKTISAYEEIKAIVVEAAVGDVLKFQVERDGKLIEVDVTCFEKVPENTAKVELD